MPNRPAEGFLELGGDGFNDHGTGDAGGAHPLHHRVAVGREGRVREVAVGVHQHQGQT
jgi:hypothetical protein